MLVLLLDENISQVVAEQVLIKRPEIRIESVHTWENGRLRNTPDEQLLVEAARSNLTLATYDLRTIPEQIRRAFEEGRDLSGVILIDHQTIPSNDVGALVDAIIGVWDLRHNESWVNRVEYLARTE